MKFNFTLIYNTLKTFEALQGLGTTQLTELALLTKEATIPSNTTLIQENEELKHIYILIKGEIIVTKTVENKRSRRFFIVNSKLIQDVEVPRVIDKYTEVILARLYSFDFIGCLNSKNMRYGFKSGTFGAIVWKLPIRYLKSVDPRNVKLLNFYLNQKEASFKSFEQRQSTIRSMLSNKSLSHKRSKTENDSLEKSTNKFSYTPKDIKRNNSVSKVNLTANNRHDMLIKENSAVYLNIVERVRNRDKVKRPNPLDIKKIY